MLPVMPSKLQNLIVYALLAHLFVTSPSNYYFEQASKFANLSSVDSEKAASNEVQFVLRKLFRNFTDKSNCVCMWRYVVAYQFPKTI